MSEKMKSKLLHITLAVVVLMLVFIHVQQFQKGDFPTLEAGKWQAVFLDNDQVYFGKIENLNSEYITLKNVYYLRTSSDLEKADSNQSLNLVKLGGELHGPEDMMYIPKKSITFWENLKPDSRVLKLIRTTAM